mgnify:CR=1 FL=1
MSLPPSGWGGSSTDGGTGATPETPTCPRHPDRVSYIRCQRCHRPVCPECQRSAAVGVQCVDCVRQGSKGDRPQRTVFGGRAGSGADAPRLTIAIIAICVLVWIGELLSPRVGALALDGAALSIDDAANQAVYGEGNTPRMIFEGRATGQPSGAVVDFRDRLEEASATARANRSTEAQRPAPGATVYPEPGVTHAGTIPAGPAAAARCSPGPIRRGRCRRSTCPRSSPTAARAAWG